MKKCTMYRENTDFAKNAQFQLLILPFFTIKIQIKKIVLSYFFSAYKQLTNQKWWWYMKKCTMYCENTDFAKNAQFRLLILPFLP